MLNAVSSLNGFEIRAKDGSLGVVSDLLFDDSTWKVRWVIVDTGGWLTERKVLVHPSAVISAEYGARELHVALTKAQVEGSPDIVQDRPVSQQMQHDIYRYYGWDPLWGAGMFGGGIYGGSMYGDGIGSPVSAAYVGAGAERGATSLDEADPHLRSIAEVTGYHVRATDGDIGHVEDVIIDSESWGVRYFIVDTSNRWFGQHVLVSAYAVTGVDWSDRLIRLDFSRERVKSSLPWDPAQAVTDEYQRRLNSHWTGPAGKGAQPG